MMLKTLVAVVLLLHGIGHIMGFLAAWTSVPMGFTDRPWILGNATVDSTAGRLWGLIWLAALVVFVVAAVAVWQEKDGALVIMGIASLLSLLAILPWWNTVTPGSKIGAVLVDLAVFVIIIRGWGTGS